MSANWCCHCGYILPLGRKNARKCEGEFGFVASIEERIYSSTVALALVKELDFTDQQKTSSVQETCSCLSISQMPSESLTIRSIISLLSLPFFSPLVKFLFFFFHSKSLSLRRHLPSRLCSSGP